MLLTITTTHKPATDLGYLLHKHPDEFQSFDLAFGKAHVFYPEAREDKTTVALLLDIDPVQLVRKSKGSIGSGPLGQYVNDRPYVASSFLSVAIAKIFRSALNGRCKSHEKLVEEKLYLEATVSMLPSNGGEELIRKLFEPLGYNLEIANYPLDEKFPEWGNSKLYSVELFNSVRLKDLLSHLYVLIPTLDDEKHYYVGDEEVEKLLRHGSEWLPQHPAQKTIVGRYLKHTRSLSQDALIQLSESSIQSEIDSEQDKTNKEEELEKPLSLNQQRINSVIERLKTSGAKSIVDLGCGEGKLLDELLKESQFEKIVGMDVSYRALEKAKKKLRHESMPERLKQRLNLIHGSLIYRDDRLASFDAATCIEVIEHMELSRLQHFERVLFEFAQPKVVVLTTPNSEYNVKFESLPAGQFRHNDHRFEWSREEFQSWANRLCSIYDYSVSFYPIGEVDSQVGAPTQMGVFER